MSKFNHEDLAFTGYSRSATISTETLQQSIRYNKIIDKIEESEVIHFCNQFLQDYKVPKTKSSFQKVEAFLQHAAIENETNKEKLSDWIASNWIKI
ncbi:hypothetical protein [Flavobacterium sp.]|uniref:hypothetical protein n=1 Tax=Flavobacterium sp. TaxID=239 RepID=UPI0026339488|nr:hypothetical protein [Flavobacterium sp.]MDG2431254.1 hypothetical protein [Flavobacterium sp.]